MIRGKVIGGKKIGRTIGFPTANIYFDDGDGVAEGVYAARVEVCGRMAHGMAYVGGQRDGLRLLEVNIFDFDGDIYGVEIGVELLDYVRANRRFGSWDELKGALAQDKINIVKLLNDR